jgi:hypothetical protein
MALPTHDDDGDGTDSSGYNDAFSDVALGDKHVRLLDHMDLFLERVANHRLILEYRCTKAELDNGYRVFACEHTDECYDWIIRGDDRYTDNAVKDIVDNILEFYRGKEEMDL